MQRQLEPCSKIMELLAATIPRTLLTVTKSHVEDRKIDKSYKNRRRYFCCVVCTSMAGKTRQWPFLTLEKGEHTTLWQEPGSKHIGHLSPVSETALSKVGNIYTNLLYIFSLGFKLLLWTRNECLLYKTIFLPSLLLFFGDLWRWMRG